MTRNLLIMAVIAGFALAHGLPIFRSTRYRPAPDRMTRRSWPQATEAAGGAWWIARMAVALYAAYMLCRPALTNLRQMQSWARNALIGFGGGLTAMPGALPAIWCDMHGFSKNQQRGLVQPFIAAMQIFALAQMLSSHNISPNVLVDLAISVPALAAGIALGIVLFNRVDQLSFRRIILIILLFSGLSLGV